MTRIVAALFAMTVSLAASAQPAPSAQPSEVVLAENAQVKLTLADYQTELLQLAPDLRGSFAADPKRVAALLNNLLAMKTLAAQARKAGVDRMPESIRRIALEADRTLAALEVQRIEANAAADFDAKSDRMTARARELYLVDRQKYHTPEEVSVSHILFATVIHGEAGALAAAREARAKLLAGADFATTAAALSDDAGSKAKGGRLDWFPEGFMDPAFTKGAFALAKPGAISEPVQTPFGYHLIRLEGRRPATPMSFDQAKPQIMAALRTNYINEQRDMKLNAIRTDPAIKANQSAIDALVQGAAAVPASK